MKNFLLLALTAWIALPTAIGAAPPTLRRHKIIQKSQPIKKIVASTTLEIPSKISIQIQKNYRVIKANGVPRHKTGQFPNSGNPHRIKAQKYNFRIPLNPKVVNKLTSLENPRYNFGIGLNGVLFDPLAREYFLGKVNSQWRYEPTSGAIALGLDTNNAHVQPNGSYHYHSMPIGLIKNLSSKNESHSPLIGWAADGFPIYGPNGYGNNSELDLITNKSSYQLKAGNRENKSENPSGYYDGTFIPDYLFVQNHGTLDRCNGRKIKTPEFPNSTYAYFITSEYPSIPRCFKGKPSNDFLKSKR